MQSPPCAHSYSYVQAVRGTDRMKLRHIWWSLMEPSLSSTLSPNIFERGSANTLSLCFSLWQRTMRYIGPKEYILDRQRDRPRPPSPSSLRHSMPRFFFAFKWADYARVPLLCVVCTVQRAHRSRISSVCSINDLECLTMFFWWYQVWTSCWRSNQVKS